jgi:hypothetical protein
MRWRRVISRTSARVIAGRMVVSRLASMDLPAPGGPSKSTLWSERLHNLQFHQRLSGCTDILLNLLVKLDNQCGAIS